MRSPSRRATPTRRWGTPGSTTRTWPSSRSAGSKPTWGRSGLSEVGAYGLVLAACGLATLANPYGPRLLTWLITDLVPPRPEIGEWHRLALPDPLFVVTAALVTLTVAAFIGSGRPRDLGQVVVLAVTAWQSFLHARHPPFLGILAGFWLPFHLDGLRGRLKKAKPERAGTPPSARAVRLLLGTTWAMALVLLVTLAVQSRTMWVNRSRAPVDALQYMADRHLAGKLVVHFDWAQYALAALAPETTVAFDGRPSRRGRAREPSGSTPLPAVGSCRAGSSPLRRSPAPRAGGSARPPRA